MRKILILALGLAISLASVQPTWAKKAADLSNDNLEVTEVIKGRGLFLKLDKAADAIFISNPEVADVEIKFANMLYVFGKESGETTLHVLDSAGKVLLKRSLIVSSNLEELNYTFKKLIPDSEIEIFSVRDKIALRGIVGSPEDAKKAIEIAQGFVDDEEGVINMINIKAANQITLRVKIAEVERSVTKNLGINWQSGSSDGNIGWGVLSNTAPLVNNQFLQDLVEGVGGASQVLTGPAGTAIDLSQSLYQAFFQFGEGNNSLDLIFDALEREGSLSILAEPSLTAISGKSAKFLAGGEIPVLSPNPQTGIATVEYKEFGIGLEFQPTLLTENRIRLDVETETSELSSTGAVQLNGFNIPALNTRSSQTTVELGDGQSLTIGGLYRQRYSDSINEFPWLSDVPVIGSLFRSQEYENTDSELLIVATPYIVEPVSANDIAMPQDGIRVPSDTDRFFHGQSLTSSLRPTKILGQSLDAVSGNIGFAIK